MSVAATIGVVIALAILTPIALVFRRVWADLRTERRRGLNRSAGGRMEERADHSGETLAGVHDLICTLAFAIAYVSVPGSQEDKLFVATAVFVAANAVLFIVSRNFEQGMLLIPWVSRLTIVVMGGLTLWLQDETFIKMNRTLYFGLLAAWSAGSLVAGAPRLQRFASKEHLRDLTTGRWRLLTLFSACSCAGLAVVNEVIWRNFSTGFWVAFQVWGWVLAELILLPLAMPLLSRHKRKDGETWD